MNESAKPTYSPGLDGVIAGESAICHVDPSAGLHYRGYDVEPLSQSATFEQVAWLLLHGELPSKSELHTLNQQIAESAELPAEVLTVFRQLPHETRTIDLLRTGVSALSAFDADVGHYDHAANIRKSIRLISRVTSVVTAGWRIRNGHKPVHSDLSLAGRFLMGVSGTKPEDWQIRMMDTILILYAEHEFNASTFAARVIASTLADIYSAITGAIGALEGPLHGGANEQAMTMLRDIGSAGFAEDWVKDKLAKKEKIMGFGHRVYKKGDSRVPVMRKLLEEAGRRTGEGVWLEICLELDRVMEQQKGLFANLDLYAAPVLHLLRIPAELNTPLFACARVAGWCAHVIEQQDHNRIIRPRCLYTGPAPRSLP